MHPPEIKIAETLMETKVTFPYCGVSRRALVADDRLVGLRLCGETVAGAWLRDVMVERQSTTELRRWLRPPRPRAAGGGSCAIA